MNNKSIVVGSRAGYFWLEALRTALLDLGEELSVVNETEIAETLWGDYGLVILDEGDLNDPSGLIFQIREKNPQARVVVFSPLPHWKQTRKILLSGAVDYTGKSYDKETLVSILRKALATPAPSYARPPSRKKRAKAAVTSFTGGS